MSQVAWCSHTLGPRASVRSDGPPWRPRGPGSVSGEQYRGSLGAAPVVAGVALGPGLVAPPLPSRARARVGRGVCPRLGGRLFLIRQLLVLREQLAAFEHDHGAAPRRGGAGGEAGAEAVAEAGSAEALEALRLLRPWGRRPSQPLPLLLLLLYSGWDFWTPPPRQKQTRLFYLFMSYTNLP